MAAKNINSYKSVESYKFYNLIYNKLSSSLLEEVNSTLLLVRLE